MAFGDAILTWIKEIRGQERERRILCPLCEYPVSEKDGVLYCEFCGWREK